MKKTGLMTQVLARISSVIPPLCIFLCFQTNVFASEQYDLVILNGRVMDPETMFDAVRNIGVKDGKIVSITKDKIKGKEVINAKGHVVAPGFIDTHVHVVDIPFGLNKQVDAAVALHSIKKWARCLSQNFKIT